MALAKEKNINLNHTQEWGPHAVDFNKDGKVSREELAAVLFARASRTHTKINQGGELVVGVDPKLHGVIKYDDRIISLGDYPERYFKDKHQELSRQAKDQDEINALRERCGDEKNLLNAIAKQAYGQNVSDSKVDPKMGSSGIRVGNFCTLMPRKSL